MKALIGYVRSIDINIDSCTVKKPNLYSQCFGTVKEIQIEISNLCEELEDYLDCYSRPLDNIGANGVHSIISLLEINSKYDEAIEANKNKMNTYLVQLDRLIVLCDSIARLGGINPDNLYLVFDIRQTTKS